MAANLITFEQRPSGAAHVQTVWRSTSDGPGTFISTAYSTWELVFWTVAGVTGASLRGPETTATHATLPADGRWIGIRFRTGAFLFGLDYLAMRDRTLELPMLDAMHFQFAGLTCEIPTFENADCLVAQLARSGRLGLDHRVSSSLYEEASAELNAKTLQRRFRSTTGLSRRAVKTIERARYAASMLRAGETIGDTIEAAGYCDQPHLTRSLKRLIGLTPATLMRPSCPQLSFMDRIAPEG
jgi:hypothetical protein